MISYNILDEPSVPVVEGTKEVTVSLRRALINADRYSLSVAEPLALLPLVRCLVTCVSVSDKRMLDQAGVVGMWERGSFDEDALNSYFEEHYDAFELFDSKRPFLQVAGLEPVSGPPKSAALLLPGEVIGNSVPLFGSVSEGDVPPVSIPKALLGLLSLHAYDTAAIKPGAKGDPEVKGGKTTGNHTGSLGQLGGVVPWGRNLFETILLNIPHRSSPDGDRPTWERVQVPGWEIRQPSGILELLTWQSRRIRLIPNEEGTAVVGCVMAAGDRMHVIPEYEPHTRWRKVKSPGDGPAVRPFRWQPAQSSWRGVDSLVALEPDDSGMTSGLLRQLDDGWIEDTYPLGVVCVGVTYGNQSAVIEDVFVDSIPLPIGALLQEDSTDIAAAVSSIAIQSEVVRRALNDLENNLREVSGGDRIPWDAGNHVGNRAMALLESPARGVLKALRDGALDANSGRLVWEKALEGAALSVADSMLDFAPPGAFAGRSESSRNAAVVERYFRSTLRKSLGALEAQRTQERNEV